MIVHILRFGLGTAILVMVLLRELANPDNPFVQRQMDEWDRPQWSEESTEEEDQ